MYMHNIHT